MSFNTLLFAFTHAVNLALASGPSALWKYDRTLGAWKQTGGKINLQYATLPENSVGNGLLTESDLTGRPVATNSIEMSSNRNTTWPDEADIGYATSSMYSMNSGSLIVASPTTGKIFELFHNGLKQVYVLHHHNSAARRFYNPVSYKLTFFAVTDQGKVEHRHRAQEGSLQWMDRSRSTAARVVPYGSAISPEGFFYGADSDGLLWEGVFGVKENVWRSISVVGGAKVKVIADARNLLAGSLFIITQKGALLEYRAHRNSWLSHGTWGNTKLSPLPASALRDLASVGSLFLRAENGEIVERWYDGQHRTWRWVGHGSPSAGYIISAPSMTINRQSFLVVASNGAAFERTWNNGWKWKGHGAPRNTRIGRARPVVMHSHRVFFMLQDAKLAERLWEGQLWKWTVYDVPEGGLAALCHPFAGPDNCRRGTEKEDEDSKLPSPNKSMDELLDHWKVIAKEAVVRGQPYPEKMITEWNKIVDRNHGDDPTFHLSMFSPVSFMLVHPKSRTVHERFYNSLKWVYFDHSDVSLPNIVQVAPLNVSFVALSDTGELLERLVITELQWVKHVSVQVPKIAHLGTVSALGLFMITQQGELYLLQRRHTESEFITYGKPGLCARSSSVSCARFSSYIHKRKLHMIVDSQTLRYTSLFALTMDGELVERRLGANPTEPEWVDHGMWGSTPLSPLPGSALKDLRSVGSLFLRTEAGTIVERWWNGAKWQWVDHGHPPSGTVLSAPSSTINRQSFFVTGSDGDVWERHWAGLSWEWHSHERPQDDEPLIISSARGAVLNSHTILFEAVDGRLAQRIWEMGGWKWLVHEVPRRGKSKFCEYTVGPDNCDTGIPAFQENQGPLPVTSQFYPG